MRTIKDFSIKLRAIVVLNLECASKVKKRTLFEYLITKITETRTKHSTWKFSTHVNLFRWKSIFRDHFISSPFNGPLKRENVGIEMRKPFSTVSSSELLPHRNFHRLISTRVKSAWLKGCYRWKCTFMQLRWEFMWMRRAALVPSKRVENFSIAMVPSQWKFKFLFK